MGCRSYTWLLLTIAPAAAAAQGFGIYEQGTCEMGRASAAVADPCPDGSAIFFNPAAIAGLSGGHATAGVTLLDVSGSFTDNLFGQKTTLNDPLIPVPHAYVTYAVTPKLGVGIGLFAPYGLQTEWPTTFDGRFSGYNNIVHTYYVQPTVAYQVSPRLKIGVGIDYVHGTVELHQRLDLSQALVPLAGVPAGTTFGQFGVPSGSDFADATLQASQSGVGAHIGALLTINDRLAIGARYLTQVSLTYNGTAQFTQIPTGLVTPASLTVGALTLPAGTNLDQFLAAPPSAGGLGLFLPGGLLAAQAVTAAIPNPDMLVLGVAYKAMPSLTLLADYQWTHWAAFSVLSLRFTPDTSLNQQLYQDYQNTSTIRLGAEWVKSDALTIRVGYLYNQAAAPDQTVTPLLPEGARNELTAGVTAKLAPRVTAAVAYQYIHQNDRLGRTRETPNVQPTTALNDGLYTFGASLFAATLSVAF
ncbi:MAG TPA: outer membrane protein transport protein [Gemmatimonadales bacterium]|nr:outer membrane protein transport protein [Gemmatimonadales bacterium]